jgi:hypothetical protein
MGEGLSEFHRAQAATPKGVSPRNEIGQSLIIPIYRNAENIEELVEAPIDAHFGPSATAGQRQPLGVGGCELWRLPDFVDIRGSLATIEFARDLPFVPQRVFFVYGVSSRVRGEHAHRACHQFLIAAHGRLNVIADDGEHRREVTLDDPRVGLHLTPMVWGVQYKFDPETVLMVMASHAYDASDYIRAYDEFRALVGPRPPAGE